MLNFDSNALGPLEGVRVLDMTRLIAGNMLSLQLADFGAEVVKIDYNPAEVSLISLLKVFWECHDPTQGMRQGNDIGTQYRSVCYCKDEEELALVKISLDQYQNALSASSLGPITTELKINQEYYLAEEYHQQYLDKNPNGYCGIGGTGCEFKI